MATKTYIKFKVPKRLSVPKLKSLKLPKLKINKPKYPKITSPRKSPNLLLRKVSRKSII